MMMPSDMAMLLLLLHLSVQEAFNLVTNGLLCTFLAEGKHGLAGGKTQEEKLWLRLWLAALNLLSGAQQNSILYPHYFLSFNASIKSRKNLKLISQKRSRLCIVLLNVWYS